MVRWAVQLTWRETWRFGMLYHFDLLFTIIRAVFSKSRADLLRHRKAVYSYTHIQTRWDLRILEGLPCPPPGDLPDPGIEPAPLRSPALAGRFFTTMLPGKHLNIINIQTINIKSYSFLCKAMDLDVIWTISTVFTLPYRPVFRKKNRVKRSPFWPEFSDRFLGGDVWEILPGKFYGAH